jgi:hypothetical protein
MLRLSWKSCSLAKGISSHDFVNRPLDDSLTSAATPRSRS